MMCLAWNLVNVELIRHSIDVRFFIVPPELVLAKCSRYGELFLLAMSENQLLPVVDEDVEDGLAQLVIDAALHELSDDDATDDEYIAF
ncbi:hypothetical protein RCL1_007934 [Eukaryota sp. TZLM3-RCL]